MHNKSLNENKNGTFINLSSLKADDINALKEYSEYVNDQQKSLATIEVKKQYIQKKYFNDNKDNIVNSTNV